MGNCVSGMCNRDTSEGHVKHQDDEIFGYCGKGCTQEFHYHEDHFEKLNIKLNIYDIVIRIKKSISRI
jgi:hypothetical protein